jgi:hypothetical protein
VGDSKTGGVSGDASVLVQTRQALSIQLLSSKPKHSRRGCTFYCTCLKAICPCRPLLDLVSLRPAVRGLVGVIADYREEGGVARAGAKMMHQIRTINALLSRPTHTQSSIASNVCHHIQRRAQSIQLSHLIKYSANELSVSSLSKLLLAFLLLCAEG